MRVTINTPDGRKLCLYGVGDFSVKIPDSDQPDKPPTVRLWYPHRYNGIRAPPEYRDGEYEVAGTVRSCIDSASLPAEELGEYVIEEYTVDVGPFPTEIPDWSYVRDEYTLNELRNVVGSDE